MTGDSITSGASSFPTSFPDRGPLFYRFRKLRTLTDAGIARAEALGYSWDVDDYGCIYAYTYKNGDRVVVEITDDTPREEDL